MVALKPFAVIEADAVVIGTGAGGAVVARELAEAGARVAILEEGDYLDAAHYGRATPMESVRMLYRKAGFTFTFGNRPILLPVGRTVGGTTVINSGTTLRARAEAIQRWRHEFGLLDLTGNLERYYERVELVQGVRRVPETMLNRAAQLFRLGAERLGYHGAVLHRNERGCRGAGRCFLGCPNNAKQGTHLTYIPRALRAGASLYTRCAARRILVRRGRVEGVRAWVHPGFPVTFRAPAVFVCGGALFTPNLLRTAGGIGGPHLGRHLKVHPATRVVGEFDEEVRAWDGVPQSYYVDEFFGRGISIEGIFLPPGVMGSQLPGFADGLDCYNRLTMLGYRIFEDAEGRVFGDILGLTRSWPIILMNLTPPDVERLREGAVRSAEILFAAGARRVFTGIRGYEVLRGPADLCRLAEAALSASDFELSGYHAQGTARMADDPAHGVCDPEGRVWGVEGLYVADASLLPATPQSNPQLSIQAFATHVAARFLERQGRSLVEPPSHVAAGHAAG
jgi:choline dehydrogenase-like flavoprotein